MENNVVVLFFLRKKKKQICQQIQRKSTFFPDYFREDVVDILTVYLYNPIHSMRLHWQTGSCPSRTPRLDITVDMSVGVNRRRGRVRAEDEGLLSKGQICWQTELFRQASPPARCCDSQLSSLCPRNHLLRRPGAAAAAVCVLACVGVCLASHGCRIHASMEYHIVLRKLAQTAEIGQHGTFNSYQLKLSTFWLFVHTFVAKSY